MPPVDVTRPEPDPRNQQPLDNDFTVLIVPEAIPVPGTSVEVLQTAAANLRAAAEEVAEGGAGVESSWQALQAHYTAPESETLLAAMGPVARKGDTVLEDVTAVVTALETFAEEAESARTRLRNIKDDAVAFVEEVRDEEFWALNPWHYSKNRSLKLWANIVWATFQEAERECATAISAVNGQGNTYTAAGGEAPGPREIAYGLDPDEVPDIAFDLTEFSEWQRAGEESWSHLTGSDKPWPLDWAADAFAAQQEHFGVGMAWGLGAGALSSTGLWRAGSGWAGSVGEVVDNAVTHKEETFQGYGALVGMYGEDGWMNPFDAEESSGQTWRENAGAAWTEVGHDLFPWREWEDRPAYTLSTAGGNLALTVVAFPVRGGMLLSRIGGGGPDIPDIDVLERTGVAWEPGAAARPGFSLAQTLSGIRTGFSDTATGIGLRLDQLRTGMAARFAHWEVVEGAPEPAGSGGAGAGAGPSPGTGPVPAHAGDGGVPDDRAGAPAAAVPAGRGDEVRVAELVADVERYSGMDAAERSALLDVRREALVGAGARGGGMEVPGGDGIGDRSDRDFRVTAAHDPDPKPATPASTPRDGTSAASPTPAPDGPSTGHGHGTPRPAEGAPLLPSPEGPPTTFPGGEGFEFRDVDDGAGDGASDVIVPEPVREGAGELGGRAEDRSSLIEDFGLGTRGGTYPEAYQDKLPTTDPMKLREFASRGRILGEVLDGMVTRRDDRGLILEVNGIDIKVWLERLVVHRGNEMAEFKDRHGLSDASLGKKGGAVNAIVIDRRTGLVAEGFNGHSNGTSIPDVEMHGLIRDRIARMHRPVDPRVPGSGYPQYNEDQEVVRYTPYPHGDTPSRHAEVKALNRLLQEREAAGMEVVVGEFQLDNRFTLKAERPGDCPCCANCYRITEGVPAPRVGKNTWPPTNEACELVGRDGPPHEAS
ncbi:hypothetical protein [Nocardiopsis sp. CA-288880]|uniref:hypothetical protein n=1 Tax=Nocardiopsis sp. CA-288880 TaxID=3239995 RepID=UPI003D961633